MEQWRVPRRRSREKREEEKKTGQLPVNALWTVGGWADSRRTNEERERERREPGRALKKATLAPPTPPVVRQLSTTPHHLLNLSQSLDSVRWIITVVNAIWIITQSWYGERKKEKSIYIKERERNLRRRRKAFKLFNVSWAQNDGYFSGLELSSVVFMLVRAALAGLGFINSESLVHVSFFFFFFLMDIVDLFLSLSRHASHRQFIYFQRKEEEEHVNEELVV